MIGVSFIKKLCKCIIGQQVGACCFPDGSCQDITESQCNQLEGFFLGASTTCETTECTGGCCTDDETCVDGLTSSGCDDLNGVFQGIGSTCDNIDCTSPAGCCLDPGGCTNLNPFDCKQLGGIVFDQPCIGPVCGLCSDPGVCDGCPNIIMAFAQGTTTYNRCSNDVNCNNLGLPPSMTCSGTVTRPFEKSSTVCSWGPIPLQGSSNVTCDLPQCPGFGSIGGAIGCATQNTPGGIHAWRFAGNFSVGTGSGTFACNAGNNCFYRYGLFSSPGSSFEIFAPVSTNCPPTPVSFSGSATGDPFNCAFGGTHPGGTWSGSITIG